MGHKGSRNVDQKSNTQSPSFLKDLTLSYKSTAKGPLKFSRRQYVKYF